MNSSDLDVFYIQALAGVGETTLLLFLVAQLLRLQPRKSDDLFRDDMRMTWQRTAAALGLPATCMIWPGRASDSRALPVFEEQLEGLHTQALQTGLLRYLSECEDRTHAALIRLQTAWRQAGG